jgi:hypothetical protein
MTSTNPSNWYKVLAHNIERPQTIDIKSYRTKADAQESMKRYDSDLPIEKRVMLICENHKKSDAMRFLVGTLASAWWYQGRRNVENRNFYEDLSEGKPVKAFLDVEFNVTEFPDVDPEDVLRDVINAFLHVLRQQFPDHAEKLADEKCLLVETACKQGVKASWHVKLVAEGMALADLAEMRKLGTLLHDYVDSPEGQEKYPHVFLSPGKCAIDWGVWAGGRCFRMLGSCKAKDKRILKLVGGPDVPTLFDWLRSLITVVPPQRNLLFTNDRHAKKRKKEKKRHASDTGAEPDKRACRPPDVGRELVQAAWQSLDAAHGRMCVEQWQHTLESVKVKCKEGIEGFVCYTDKCYCPIKCGAHASANGWIHIQNDRCIFHCFAEKCSRRTLEAPLDAAEAVSELEKPLQLTLGAGPRTWYIQSLECLGKLGQSEGIFWHVGEARVVCCWNNAWVPWTAEQAINFFHRHCDIVHLSEQRLPELSITQVRGFLTDPRLKDYLSPLIRVAQQPILAEGSDGTVRLLHHSGYDAETKILLQLPEVLEDLPLPESIENATALVLDLLSDFPFEDESSRANAVALLLTPHLRQLLEVGSCVPMAAVSTPKAGSGKTELAKLASALCSGRAKCLISPPSSDDEWRKLLTTLLRDGERMLVLDNVRGSISSAVLEKAITDTKWSDRVLGTNSRFSSNMDITVVATGRNLTVAKDMVRRTYMVRLDPKSARPELDGRQWKHKAGLEAHVCACWPQLLGAVLFLIREAWNRPLLESDKPQSWTSFDKWAEAIQKVLLLMGVKGFLDNLKADIAENNDEDSDIAQFVMAVHGIYADTWFTSAKLSDLVQHHECSSLTPSPTVNAFVKSLPSHLDENRRQKSWNTFVRELGKAIGDYRNNRVVCEDGNERWLERKERGGGRKCNQSREWRVCTQYCQTQTAHEVQG